MGRTPHAPVRSPPLGLLRRGSRHGSCHAREACRFRLDWSPHLPSKWSFLDLAQGPTLLVMRVEEGVEIERPPADVWAVIADPSHDTRWCPKVKSVQVVAPHRWRVMHKPVPLRPAVVLDVEHLSLEEPSRLAMREEDEASTFEVEYRLQPTPRGTRLTQTSDFEWKKLPRFLHGTFKRGVRRDVRRQLRELKRLLEAS